MATTHDPCSDPTRQDDKQSTLLKLFTICRLVVQWYEGLLHHMLCDLCNSHELHVSPTTYPTKEEFGGGIEMVFIFNFANGIVEWWFDHTNQFKHHPSSSSAVVVVGQHLFLNIIPNNFTARTGWKVWCGRGPSHAGVGNWWSRLKPSYEFHFEGLSNSSLSIEGLVQIKTSIQEYRNEVHNLHETLCMNSYCIVHVSSTMHMKN